VAAIVELRDPEWALVEALFDPAGRRGVPAHYPRHQMVEAILFLARTGIQWRYLPDRYPRWEALHLMALVQARTYPSARSYLERRRDEGKTWREAVRCLKRHLADVSYRTMLHDLDAEQAGA
jgi:transposase